MLVAKPKNSFFAYFWLLGLKDDIGLVGLGGSDASTFFGEIVG
jgi:hypothetical protein